MLHSSINHKGDLEMINSISDDFYSGVLGELKHKKDRVSYILEHFPDARNNDNTLCLIYWKLVDKVERVEDIQFATKAEVLRRARQKIQNDNKKFPPTSEDIIIKRRMQAEHMRQGIHSI